MLQTFSRTLVELYESAEDVGLNAFPAEVVRLVGRLIGFDGAVLGMGESPALDPQTLVIHSAFVHGRDPGILADYEKVSTVDPMTHGFVAGRKEPLCSSLSAIPPTKSMDDLRAFHSIHDLQQLVLVGEVGGQHNPARWLVLYRGAGEPFDAHARHHVAAVWPHLARSLATNRSRFLQGPQRNDIGAALINSGGYIEVAEPLFRKLCAREWPAGVGRKMPEVVWDSWRRGQDYVGVRVRFKVQLQHDDFIVGQACAIGPMGLLTPAERIVATRFAAGLSAKAIADALGLSTHTVRSHLTRVYSKLDVHDKGALASLLANRASDSTGFAQ